MLSKDYAWYVENGQIAIVEPSTSGDTTWQAISDSGRTVKIYAERNATDFNSTLTDDNKTYNLPNRFRRIIAYLVISRAYEIPPHINLDMARHFYNKYREGL